jgi:hypothetical protein
MKLDSIDYGLSESCDCKQKREGNQPSVRVFLVTNKDYKFLDLSKKFPNAGSEL